MSASRSPIPQVDELERDRSPEDLFVTLYRCAMAGLGFGDTASWRFGQSLLARHVPAQDVGPLFGQFYGFARAVIAASQGSPSWWPLAVREISAEETLALRMIEMSQRSDPAAVLSAAAMLVGSEDLGAVFESAQSLARALALCGLFPERSNPERAGRGRVAGRCAAARRPPGAGASSFEGLQ